MSSKKYDKSEKGREEIATRKYHLSPRSRTLLVMIDGKQTTEDIFKNFGYLGFTEQNLVELIDENYIVEVSANGVPRAAPKAEKQPIATQTTPEPATAPLVTITTTAFASAQQINELKLFFTETIQHNIGLRGYTLQVQVDRAKTLGEFAVLRTPYLEAVTQARGKSIAIKLQHQLDQLLIQHQQQ